jgi:hypothetical protein
VTQNFGEGGKIAKITVKGKKRRQHERRRHAEQLEGVE